MCAPAAVFADCGLAFPEQWGFVSGSGEEFGGHAMRTGGMASGCMSLPFTPSMKLMSISVTRPMSVRKSLLSVR